MRKIFSVTVALLLAAAILSTGALAQGGKDPKGTSGADKGQKQSQADTVKGAPDRGFNGKGPQKEIKEPAENPPADDGGITDDNDDSTVDETPGKPPKDKETKHDEKLPDGPNHGNAYGRRRNTVEVLDAIGQLAGGETAAQLTELFGAYRAATDAETARAALTTLLDALTQACLNTASDENGDGTDAQEPLSLMDIEKMREKVLANAGNDNGTLLALMRAYENALRYTNHLEPIEDTEDGPETEEQTNDGTGEDTAPNP